MKNIEKTFKNPLTNCERCGRISRQGKTGRLVKRLRHQPLTLKTWVRFPYRSPAHRKHHICGAFLFCVLVAGTFRPHSREQRALFIAMSIIALFFHRSARIGFETLLRRLPWRPRKAEQIPVPVCRSG